MLRSLLIPSAVMGLAVSACVSPLANTKPELRSGRELVELRCSGCHAVELTDVSRNAAAPPLRDMFKRYPLYALESAFRQGLEVGHRDMPKFSLPPDEVAAILSYLESLDPCAKPSADEAEMARCFAPL